MEQTPKPEPTRIDRLERELHREWVIKMGGKLLLREILAHPPGCFWPRDPETCPYCERRRSLTHRCKEFKALTGRHLPGRQKTEPGKGA